MANELSNLRLYAIRKGVETSLAYRSNEVALWRLLASKYGVSPVADLNEVSALRKILERHNVPAEGLSETVLLRKLAILEGDSVQGAANRNEAGLLSFLAYPFESQPPPPPLDLTNAQKLSLPTSTPIGTQVRVSDGFVVSGANDPNADGFYFPDGTTVGGKAHFIKQFPFVGDGTDQEAVYDTTRWKLGSDSFGYEDADPGNQTFPWEASWNTSALTHPAVQQLAAPGRGALLVSGGTGALAVANGVWIKDNPSQGGGRPSYTLVGYNIGGDFVTQWHANLLGDVGIGPSSPGWAIQTNDGAAYSLSDTPTPLTATGWKNASDDSPASIVITLTDPQGGVFVSGGTQDGVYTIRGTTNGKQYFDILGTVDPDPDNGVIKWDGSQWSLIDTGGGTLYYSTSAVATPDLVTDVFGVVTIDFNDFTIQSDENGTINKYGKVENSGATNGAFIFEYDSNLTLNDSYVSWNLAEGNLLTVGVYVDGTGTNQPTKQQSIDKLVAIGGGRITDIGGLKISVVLNDHLSDTMNFAGGVGLAGPMTGSSYTTSPIVGWKNASDDSPAAITVTSVSQGELDAGVTVAGAGTSAINQPYIVQGNNAGRNNYANLAHLADATIPHDIWTSAWSGSEWDIDDNSGVSVFSVDNVAFPWSAVFLDGNAALPPAPTVTRNDVAAEANWNNV